SLRLGICSGVCGTRSPLWAAARRLPHPGGFRRGSNRMRQPIRLRGISGDVKGKVWEADNLLRAGRLGTLEIVLDDGSVSRRHAEVRRTETGWWVRDLESTNGTYVNGVRLTNGERQPPSRDIAPFGKAPMTGELTEPTPGENSNNGPPSDQIQVEASTNSSWEEGFERLLADRNHSPRAGDQLLALLRAGHHLVTTESEEELLHRILQDAVAVLDAQRGA